MIKIEELKKTYDRNTKRANTVLRRVSLTLPDKGFVCILGESGCGKTSLLNAIGGLDSFDSGRITTENTEISRSGSRAMERERNASFGYIFQNYYLLGSHSVAYNVFLGLHTLPISKKEKMDRIKYALERVDMLRFKRRRVDQLSGGQQQRVAIARAIARSPKVIFADEPTGNLDEANTISICSLLKEISKESLVVMVTHEERIARFFADRIITLKDGEVASDVSDWEREEMDAGAKDTLYAAEYNEAKIEGESISLRLLSSDKAEGIEMTVVAEKDRIIIKVNDPRVVICSDTNASPYLEEGKRPVIDQESLKENTYHGYSNTTPSKKKRKSGLGISMLWREARALVTENKLRKIGVGLFIVLLTVMLSISVADAVAIAHIDPEDFITTDSHALAFNFGRGAKMIDKYDSIMPSINEYREHLDASGLEFDYIPISSSRLEYTDTTVAQLGELSMEFHMGSHARLARLDPSALIHGRMPERSDEIVIDRWIIDKMIEGDGVLQNVIPNAEYLVGKKLSISHKTITATIVGICDSGEPTIYMSDEFLLGYATYGVEAITLSEYKRITGYNGIDELGDNECIVLLDNAGQSFMTRDDVGPLVRCDYPMKSVGWLANTDDSIGAKIIISDTAVAPLYRAVINKNDNFVLWCSDKQRMLEYLDAKLPEDLEGMLDIKVGDAYSRAYAAYEEKTAAKLDGRTIIIVSTLLASAVMLYLMQRANIRDHGDLVAVYRLLGMPKRDLVFVFAVESLIQTFKFALPTVLAIWLGLMVAPKIDFLPAFELMFPIEAAAFTFAIIAVYRLIVSSLPILRLMSYPPARLAAKYDF